MIRFAHAAAALFALAACSAPHGAGPPPAKLDEQRALVEAREMIPPDEIASAPVNSPKPDETPPP